mgnify:CR=1 FL=1
MGSVLVSGKPLKRADARVANYTLQGYHKSQPNKFTHQHIKLGNYDGETAADLDPYIDTTQYLELERTDALGKFSGKNLVNGKPNKQSLMDEIRTGLNLTSNKSFLSKADLAFSHLMLYGRSL